MPDIIVTINGIEQPFEYNPRTGIVTVYPQNDIELVYDNEPVKKPLFTTEDGVEKFEGDDCFFIDTEKSDKPTKWYGLPKPLRSEGVDISRLKYFHSEEKAKEYIQLNKPVLVSYNELMEYMEKVYLYPTHNQVIKDFFKNKTP